jgi:hypothetical protein
VEGSGNLPGKAVVFVALNNRASGCHPQRSRSCCHPVRVKAVVIPSAAKAVVIPSAARDLRLLLALFASAGIARLASPTRDSRFGNNALIETGTAAFQSEAYSSSKNVASIFLIT